MTTSTGTPPNSDLPGDTRLLSSLLSSVSAAGSSSGTPQQFDDPNSKALRQTSRRLTFSPFGALASSSVAPIRKPVRPPLINSPLLLLSHAKTLNESGPAPIDPKRKSVDDLLEQLGTSKVPVPPSARTLSSFDQHGPEEETLAAQPVQSKAASRRLPPNSHKPLRRMVPRPRSLPPFVGMFGHRNPL
ncbi:hypothetical protein BC826DRAFT_1109773 [Russula brevipes]|nr:hypothetical protein BC826DRAFT_1109773 [Russula brevipes]